jgi:hypothetical protein
MTSEIFVVKIKMYDISELSNVVLQSNRMWSVANRNISCLRYLVTKTGVLKVSRCKYWYCSSFSDVLLYNVEYLRKQQYFKASLK